MILAATVDGVCDIETGEAILVGNDVGFVSTLANEAWALVAGQRVLRDGGSGWCEVARLERGTGLVAIPTGEQHLLIGTTGAHILRSDGGALQRLESFDRVPGRASWTNPAAAGRPDVWSFASNADGVYASVHVGGLWRSSDDGESWTNVLAAGTDVHQVAAADGVVVVAAEHGFGFSDDGGNSWSWTIEGLHASYLQCVALTDDAVYVGASSGPMDNDAAVYRASLPARKFERRSAGLPDVFESIGPYHLVADGDNVAVAPWFANTVFASNDSGASWSRCAREFPTIHSLATR